MPRIIQLVSGSVKWLIQFCQSLEAKLLFPLSRCHDQINAHNYNWSEDKQKKRIITVDHSFHEVQNSVTPLKKWPVTDGIKSPMLMKATYRMTCLETEEDRHLCCFGPVSECSLLVVDVSESWLEVAANNSRLSRHNVNYTSAELAQDINSQPCHWVIITCCKHTRTTLLVTCHQNLL